MSKFTVTATMTNTFTITKVIESNNLQSATIELLQTNASKWNRKLKLDTSSK